MQCHLHHMICNSHHMTCHMPFSCVTCLKVEDFWRLCNNIMPPSELEKNSNYHFFKVRSGNLCIPTHSYLQNLERETPGRKRMFPINKHWEGNEEILTRSCHALMLNWAEINLGDEVTSAFVLLLSSHCLLALTVICSMWHHIACALIGVSWAYKQPWEQG